LKLVYVFFLALQFIMALGNRPKGERIPYVVTLWVFAVLAIYLLVCSFVLTIKAFISIPAQLAGKTASEIIIDLLKPPIGALIVAMISTFGIYFVASFLYRDPWHMFSSFFQYLCLAPSFTNVLNVYAFCNLHDVSWGTKGSDKAEALPSVSSKPKGGEAVVEDQAHVQADVDANFRETVTRAMTRIETKEVREKPTMDDENKTFRTRLVAMWMLTNAGLAFAIESLSGVSDTTTELESRQSTYFAIILYSTFGLSAVRFIGCVYYFITRNLFRCFRKN